LVEGAVRPAHLTGVAKSRKRAAYWCLKPTLPPPARLGDPSAICDPNYWLTENQSYRPKGLNALERASKGGSTRARKHWLPPPVVGRTGQREGWTNGKTPPGWEREHAQPNYRCMVGIAGRRRVNRQSVRVQNGSVHALPPPPVGQVGASVEANYRHMGG
jgi:hypothetical protein